MAYENIETLKSAIGGSVTGRAITATLYVSPDGDNSNDSSWAKAYQTIQGALDAASTDANDCTLILVGPHATYYDIDTTGDSTWTGNYEIKGTHRLWAPVRNEHNGANYAGVAVSAGEDDYGADTELRAAATATRPFKVIGFKFEPSEEKKFLTRFSADSGSTFFNMDLTEVKKNKATGASQGTDFIFNVGIRISCSSGCEVAGKTIQV